VTRYILDTDHVTLLQYGHPLITTRSLRVGEGNIFTTTVTLEEQLEGRLVVIRQAATRPQYLATAYENLRRTHEYFCAVNRLDFDSRATKIYLELRSRRIRVGSHDLRIAAIALANQMVVATRNRKDFELVPELQIDDWTVA
jgi:tRNA(fMet)-specific endonuclease VapC